MFSLKRVLQALYYIQSKVENPDKYSIMYQLKMLYFADRYHLRHYGCLASEDKYKAMRRGPVAHITYNALQEKNYGFNSAELPFLKQIEPLDETNYKIKPQDEDELSESYKKALDFAVSVYGKFNHIELSEISHDYPEWKNHQNETSQNPWMNLKDFFDNPENLNNSEKYGISKDPFEEDAEFLSVMREEVD